MKRQTFIQKENKRFQSLKKKQQKFMEEDKVEDLMILSEDLRPVHGFEKVVERNNYINKYNLHAYVYEGGYVKLMDFSKGNRHFDDSWIAAFDIFVMQCIYTGL